MANRKERIAKGIQLLDKKVPGWCEKVDLKMLKLGSLQFCVLGQVFAKEAKRSRTYISGYGYGRERLFADEAADVYGFDTHSEAGEQYFPLTLAWKRAIRAHCRK